MLKDLVYYNDPRLRQGCARVRVCDASTAQVAQDLADSVVHHSGAGMSAPQIGHMLRVIVICLAPDVAPDGSAIVCDPKIYINPEIIEKSSETIIYPEGSLSIPGLTEEVERVKKIKVKALDVDGNMFEEEADLWRARVILHEMDYLDGDLFIDKLEPGAQLRIVGALESVDKEFNKTSR
ncbi:peptide deformylase [Candidatus Aerophobetes bacterium]|uniref:Peptide deformylase-like n=1 Tax=Aerophobetes bacterium TaxID=2030807 RepID=A0A2A4X8V2_UNCAE|nr:MAG: peptide deformylase [Candidatus Aerophobetes bacterium]